MKLIQLYQDYNVPFQTEGHKHCRDGWVNTECPFCTGNPGLHLGATLDGKIFTCWRCGWKPSSKAIAKLIGVSEKEAKNIIRKYGGKPLHRKNVLKRTPRIKSHKLPTDTGSLKKQHKKYLIHRGFNPDKLEKQWKLLGTGPMSKLDDIYYKNRILAPIYWDRKRVSFQTRDITDLHKAKYMACPEDRELIKHKHILYGKQHKWNDTGICVEGITDVWRMGYNAFAVFGIKFTRKQVRQITKHFKRVIILFDDDPQAIKQAKLLKAELLIRGVEAIIEDIKGDPASLMEQDAKNILKKFY